MNWKVVCTISKLKYFLTLAIMVSVVVSENLQKIKKIRRFRSPGEKIEGKIDDLTCKQLLLENVRLYFTYVFSDVRLTKTRLKRLSVFNTVLDY